jgi:hypothetical protein
LPYAFALNRPDYSDLAAGKVLLAAPGCPAFPVRLAVEMFERCRAVRAAAGFSGRAAVYDPCCGAGYLVTVLGILCGEAMGEIFASDVDGKAIERAERNLGLLTPTGFERRRAEIEEMRIRFGKDSHAAALAAADRIRRSLFPVRTGTPVRFRTFLADAFDASAVRRGLADAPVDIVITDVPYGLHSHWRTGGREGGGSLDSLLEAIRPALSDRTILAVASDKKQKAAHPGYRRIEKFQIGKRRILLLQPETAGVTDHRPRATNPPAPG